MGVGVALIPGGNNSLILAAIPALSPGGTAAYLLMTATIVLGLSTRARIFRKRTAASRHVAAVPPPLWKLYSQRIGKLRPALR